MEQFRGGGRVLEIGFDAARIFDGHGHGECAEIAGLLVGQTGSNVDSHIGDDIVTRWGRRKYDLKG
jgi:hypothetical protein